MTSKEALDEFPLEKVSELEKNIHFLLYVEREEMVSVCLSGTKTPTHAHTHTHHWSKSEISCYGKLKEMWRIEPRLLLSVVN